MIGPYSQFTQSKTDCRPSTVAVDSPHDRATIDTKHGRLGRGVAPDVGLWRCVFVDGHARDVRR